MASTPTNGDDVIFGTDGKNRINALGGDDLVFGGLGNDVLTGGSGNDQLSGGLGVDVLSGGTGSDTAFYGFSGEAVWANLDDGNGYLVSQGADADTDFFASIENLSGGFGGDTLIGDEFANRIDGNSGDDLINGGGGNDTANGGNGNDFIAGQDGNDAIDGGSGDDMIRGGLGGDAMSGGGGADMLDYIGSASGVSVDLLNNTAGGGEAAGDIISGFENAAGSLHDDALLGTNGANLLGGGNGNDTLTGRGGNDMLRGQDGDDAIRGGGGDDSISGLAGADNLTGGGGADRFFLETLADSGVTVATRDTIVDFTQGADRIYVSTIDAVAATVVDNAFSFIGTDAFTAGVAGEARYFHNNGFTIVEFRVDTSGADMRIALNGLLDLVQTDFIL